MNIRSVWRCCFSLVFIKKNDEEERRKEIKRMLTWAHTLAIQKQN